MQEKPTETLSAARQWLADQLSTIAQDHDIPRDQLRWKLTQVTAIEVAIPSHARGHAIESAATAVLLVPDEHSETLASIDEDDG